MSEIDLTTLSSIKSIQLSHGGGGQEMNKLIKGLFFKAFDNDILRSEEDVPVSEEVRGLCELYGFEPFDLANEGTFILRYRKNKQKKH